VPVDVVVVSYNSSSHLRAAVGPLAGRPGVRVVVVDNASADGSLEAVADLPVERIALADNRGFAVGCNAGWREGSAPAVLFLNPDARIDPTSLERLVQVLNGDDSVALVGPRIVDAAGGLEPSQRRFPALRSTYARAFFLHRLFPHAEWSDELIRDGRAYERAASPDWVSGACMLVRRSALEAIGGFDEGYFLYCEDIDLARRLRDAGYGVRFEPGAVAVHEGGASAPRPRLIPLLALSRLRYLRKFDTRPRVALARLGLALTAFTHVLVSRGGAAQRLGHARALLLLAFARRVETERAAAGITRDGRATVGARRPVS
jgi:GT2 family glycosyltransferase